MRAMVAHIQAAGVGRAPEHAPVDSNDVGQISRLSIVSAFDIGHWVAMIDRCPSQ